MKKFFTLLLSILIFNTSVNGMVGPAIIPNDHAIRQKITQGARSILLIN